MAFAIFDYLRNFLRNVDELRVSDALVRKLSVPEHTKQFVFAIREPESQCVLYILCVQNLSERSATDAEYLIREIRPDAVVAQADGFSVTEVQSENIEFENHEDSQVPTSSFEVLRRCFVHKTNQEKYESLAGRLVLTEIFGISFHGHFLAAKRAAEEVGASFLLLGYPSVNSGGEDSPNSGNMFHALALQPACLVPWKVGSVVPKGLKIHDLTDEHYLHMVKSLSSIFNSSSPDPKADSGDSQPNTDYVAPSFAQSFYPLLSDLHDIFVDIPSIGRALAHTQKMLYDVNKGGMINTQLLSEVYIFRIAIEGLRIARNNVARLPVNKMSLSKTDFSELPLEDKSHALLAQAIRSQTRKFKSVVAIVDASGLVGLRKHWNTIVPLDVKDLVEEQVINFKNEGGMSNNNDRKSLLTHKPVVAVGAGATAIFGASSLFKYLPASTFMKIVTFKTPASVKLIMAQSQKVIAIALSKTVGPSKVLFPGIASTGTKTTSALKAAASAEKIRVVAQSVLASAERTSISAMRTSFYEIMRSRRVRRIGFLPWATFGCSIAACAGLLVYGDGIECAAESFPVAPSIASLGRGIQNLRQAGQVVKEAESSRIQKSIESFMCRFKKMKA